jgi:hypothetical protein
MFVKTGSSTRWLFKQINTWVFLLGHSRQKSPGTSIARRRWRGGRDEHFIWSIVFLNKYPIYHLFFDSVRKMSECFSQ